MTKYCKIFLGTFRKKNYSNVNITFHFLLYITIFKINYHYYKYIFKMLLKKIKFIIYT